MLTNEEDATGGLFPALDIPCVHTGRVKGRLLWTAVPQGLRGLRLPDVRRGEKADTRQAGRQGSPRSREAGTAAAGRQVLPLIAVPHQGLSASSLNKDRRRPTC